MQVALLLPQPRPERFRVIAYNSSSKAQRAQMTGWNIAAGRWRLRSGTDRDGDDRIDGNGNVRELEFARSVATEVVFAPRATTVLELELAEPGEAVELRADVGIGRGDVRRDGDALAVTVHSLGHSDAPSGVAILEDARGRELARAPFGALPAPRDLLPKTQTVRLAVPANGQLQDARVRLVLEGGVGEVTQVNNVARVVLP